ncbi:hypothetical protein GQ44DRAFT_767532 [Phaeosphaeriaceae sp. PMI808]|nr:hypothetical protein GQ44DRAFT_767532 [Phaeosphaeriaceae sp. PMI808]
MLFKPLAFIALVGSACADFIIMRPFTMSGKDRSQLSFMTKAYGSEMVAYYTSLAKAPEYSKAMDAIKEY